MTARLASLPVLLATVLLVGCTADTEPPYVAESPSPERAGANPSVNLGAPVASTVEAVSVPESATPNGNTYLLPESVTLEDLSTWYDEHLPRGADWQGWSWCQESHEIDGDEYGFQRLYVRKGSASILTVVLADPSAEPAFVFIGTDESGPCT